MNLENENLEIKVERIQDKLSVFIENKSERNFYLSKNYPLNYMCSKSGKLISVKFGVDLKDFTERWLDLEIIKPGNNITREISIADCTNYSTLSFTYGFFTTPKEIEYEVNSSEITRQEEYREIGSWIWEQIYIKN